MHDGKTKDDATPMTFPAAQKLFGEELVCVAQFNALPPDAKMQVEAALDFTASTPNPADALDVLADLRDALADQFGALAARVDRVRVQLGGRPVLPATTTVTASPAPSATPAPAPAAAPPKAPPPPPLSEGPLAKLSPAARDIVGAALEGCEGAPTPGDAAAYLRSCAVAARPTSAEAAATLEFLATAIEHDAATGAPSLADLSETERAIVEGAMRAIEGAPNPIAALEYLEQVAGDCEANVPAAARCLRHLSNTIRAAASAQPARAAA